MAIEELVEKEVSHGLKFVTDGEFRRRWWHLELDEMLIIHFQERIDCAKAEDSLELW